MRAATWLSRALPAQRSRFDDSLEDVLPLPSASKHYQPRRLTPYPGKARQRREYAPFGPQKVQEEPAAPFERPAEPDVPPPEPEPEQDQELILAPREPDRVRAPARLHVYQDEPAAPSAPPRAEPASLFPSLRSQDDPARQRRLGRSVYDALETHGHFGLVDGGETMAGGVRKLVLHVPKRNRGYALDVKVGDAIYANSARGTQARGRLDVLFVSRHKYVPPGHAVTSCAIGVPEEQWRRFTP
jgi:hypothetical protein